MKIEPSRNEPPNSPAARQPVFNNVPVLILALGGVIVAVTLAQLFGPDAIEDWLLRAGAVATGQITMDRPFGSAAPYFLHVFLHANILHLTLNMAALLSFGPPVVRAVDRSRKGMILFLTFFFACAFGGAAFQTLLVSESALMIGASSALSGLLAAAGFLLGRWRGMIRLALPWVVINLALAILGDVISLPIAWAAHLGGVATGLILAPLIFIKPHR